MAIEYVNKVTVNQPEMHHVSDMFGNARTIAGKRGSVMLEVMIDEGDSELLRALHVGCMTVKIIPVVEESFNNSVYEASPKNVADHW